MNEQMNVLPEHNSGLPHQYWAPEQASGYEMNPYVWNAEEQYTNGGNMELCEGDLYGSFYQSQLAPYNDPGVQAVSKALFSRNPAFTAIPLQGRKVFRRRKRQDGPSEWSQSFVSRVDCCSPCDAEVTCPPYYIENYKDENGNIQSAIDFSTFQKV